MSFMDTYLAVLTKLEAKLRTLEDAGVKVFDQVITGRKKAPKSYPCAFIFPDPIPMQARSTAKTERQMTFTVIAVSKESDARAGFEDALNRVSLVSDMLEADRSFEDTCDRLEIIQWIPEVERPRALERHEAGLSVTFFVIM